jgi:hypothetical protein
MKYLQHTFETPETLETYACNMHVYATSTVKYLKHPDKILATYV